MINLRNSTEQLNCLVWKEYNLKLSKLCFEKYKETSEQEYLDWANIFMEWSNTIENNYLK